MDHSGNDALVRAAAAAGLEIDWDILALGRGVGGEDLDESGEGVHL